MDQHTYDPQSWNLYGYVRNNPLKYVDPSSEAIQLMGTTDEERQKELAAIQASLVNSKVAGNLYVKPELDKNGNETGRYFVRIKGRARDFAKAGDQESFLAAAISSATIAQFGLGNETTIQDGPSWMPGFLAHKRLDVGEFFGGEATHDEGVTPSGLITLTIDPNDIRDRQSTREGIPEANLGEITAHALGHVYGYMMGISGRTNDEMARGSENAARARGGPARRQKQRHNDAKERWRR